VDPGPVQVNWESVYVETETPRETCHARIQSRTASVEACGEGRRICGGKWIELARGVLGTLVLGVLVLLILDGVVWGCSSYGG
jgi:hypothetical protein